MKINGHKRHSIQASRYIKSDDEFDMMEPDDTDGVMDAINDVADRVDDIKDTVEDVKEDAVDIAINNNISGHFIAECEDCQGVFISAVVESDQKIDHVSGICPLCNKETDQYLKWIIKDADFSEEEEAIIDEDNPF